MLACGIALWYSTFQEQKNGRFPGLMIYNVSALRQTEEHVGPAGFVGQAGGNRGIMR